jgi:hypothetical protein
MTTTAFEFKTDRFERVRVTRRDDTDRGFSIIAYRHACLERSAIRSDIADGGRNTNRIAMDILERTCNEDEWGDDEVDAIAAMLSYLDTQG